MSVQPWGSDSDKRRYYLIEGLDDTAFRVYRESNPQGFSRTWWSVAGSIEELNALVDKLQTMDGGPKARKLAQQILAAIPRFEATEEKRRRREYRQMQKERFKRPEPGFSMYEGRTRGKRIKYTYSDDDEFTTDSSNRRSARNTGTSTPAEPAGPVTTASGRQIKAPSRMTVDSSNNIVTTSPDAPDGDNETVRSKESSVAPAGRPKRSAAVNHGTNGWSSTKTRGRSYNSDGDEDEDEDESSPDLGDDEEDDAPDETEEDEDEDEEEDEEMADEDLDNGSSKSHIITMKIPSKSKSAEKKNDQSLNLDDYRYNGSAAKPAAEKEDTPEERSEESIAVATTKKREAYEPSKTTDAEKLTGGSPNQTLHPPATPGPLPSTSLAFRKSPDKMKQGLAAPPPQSVDVGR